MTHLSCGAPAFTTASPKRCELSAQPRLVGARQLGQLSHISHKRPGNLNKWSKIWEYGTRHPARLSYRTAW